MKGKGVIHSRYLNDSIYNLSDVTYKIPASGFNFNLYTISEEYIARPDLVSLDLYGTTEYADIICKLNGVSNPFELNAGMELILPNINDINKFYSGESLINEIDYKDDDQVNYYLAPIKKAKSDKTRKPNEAIIGDNRFKIDRNTGIIIY